MTSSVQENIKTHEVKNERFLILTRQNNVQYFCQCTVETCVFL